MVADAVAALQLGHVEVYTGEESLPRKVKTLLRIDQLEMPYIRP